MSLMWSWLLQIYAILATIPFLIFPLVWMIGHAAGLDNKHAVRRSTDVTMFFLIGSVAALYDQLFSTAFKGIWVILLFMLLLGGVLGNLQMRVRGKVDAPKIIRAVWRLSFIVLCPLYIILFAIEMLKRILQI